ncbi:4Fe-4S binding protein [Eggerthellaceae bacterium zg-997]|nr:4Fe-4S binding protein [Eggerthellaceae bacterium zg-997]
MIRRVIQIDDERCDGCGVCATACHEGAIAIVDGKARLMRDDYCDGLGDCLPACPTNAISFIEREAADYDAAAVAANLRARARGSQAAASGATAASASAEVANAMRESMIAAARHMDVLSTLAPAAGATAETPHDEPMAAAPSAAPAAGVTKEGASAPGCSCPGSHAQRIVRQSAVGTPAASVAPSAAGSAAVTATTTEPGSELTNWPVQIKLAPTGAPYFQGAHLLIAADCCAYAYAGFHQRFMRNRVALIGCPKLDAVDYADKLCQIIRDNDIRSVAIARMEVPCCAGIEHMAVEALKASGKFIPWQVVTFSRDGRVLDA